MELNIFNTLQYLQFSMHLHQLENKIHNNINYNSTIFQWSSFLDLFFSLEWCLPLMASVSILAFFDPSVNSYHLIVSEHSYNVLLIPTKNSNDQKHIYFPTFPYPLFSSFGNPVTPPHGFTHRPSSWIPFSTSQSL